MERKVGLWVDHRKAVIVTITPDGSTSKTLESEVEPRFHYSGGSRSSTTYGSQQAGAEKTRDERHTRQLATYYARVISEIGDAGSVFIMGPGEAKQELRKRLEASKDMAARIACVEPSDKLTDPQITARVKQFYNVPR
ncbi:hypothetical protein KKA85_12135 [bacterium]|nr:hypothetical protein [bacterium]MBU1676516.1 hypothetical protein [bacterium]